MTSASQGQSDPQRRYVGLLIFSALAALPYLAVRRRLSTVHADLHTANRQLALSIRETGKLRSTIAMLQEQTAKQGVALRNDVKTVVAEVSKERAQMGEVKTVLEEMNESMEELRVGKEETRMLREENRQADARMHQSLGDLKEAVKRLQETAKRTDQMRFEREDARYQQLLNLLRENYNERNRTHASALKDVGRSLADIAAFMHEVEVRQGYVPSPDDKRGIERARQLAKKLQELSNTLPNGSSSQIVQQPQTTSVSPKTDKPKDLLSH